MSNKGCRHLTAEQRAQILELHHTGRSTRDVATVVGCSADQVRTALKRAGEEPSGRRNNACYTHADELRRWATEGMSLSEMARRIGTNRTRVQVFFRGRGIDYTPFHSSGANNPAWKGGRLLDKTGYVLILMPEHPQANRHGYVREHRIVMERMLGRPLRPGEVVHHKNNDRQDNRPENLTLYESNGKHLAETLAGQCPNWTPEGLARIQERWNRLGDENRASSRKASAPGDPPSPGTSDPTAS